jgi:hypothetical protein
MSPIQQMFLGLGAVTKKTYMDDLFSTYLYKGNATARSINNGIDLAGEGGLVWTKSRSHARNHSLHDSARGVTCLIKSNSDTDQYCDATQISSFNSNGFSIGTDGSSNTNGDDYTSWTFRKAPGFFDVLTYTGNGSARTIAHSLGSVPGMIIIKKTSASDPWSVYHRSIDTSGGYNAPEDYRIFLDESDGRVSANTSIWNQTKPTSTHFSLGNNDQVNGNGATYVAYLFAGGEDQTTSTARSVGTGSQGVTLHGTSSDYAAGTGDFTAECWFYSENINIEKQTLMSTLGDIDGSATGWQVRLRNTGRIDVRQDNSVRIQSEADLVRTERDRWWHVALVRHSGVVKLYVNGEQKGVSWTSSQDFSNTTLSVFDVEQGLGGTNERFDGKISNVRFVKGQALYTSSFRAPTAPLTTTSQGATASNVKLIACNGSTATSTTVNSGWTNTGTSFSLTTLNPFDDPAGFVFGETADQNIIKTDSFKVDSGNANVYLGWEPQWVLVKNVTDSGAWFVFDAMRGIVTNEGDNYLRPDTTGTEGTGSNFIDLTPTGFNISNLGGTQTFIFTAIRRSDAYVGKLPSLNTDVFNVTTADSTLPAFNTNFPVDFAMVRTKDISSDWRTSGRLIQGRYIRTNFKYDENAENDYQFDYEDGWNDQASYSSSVVGWMWARRPKSFEVVTYKGNGVQGRDVMHGMGVAPNMIWVKNRTRTTGSGADWNVYVSDITYLSVYGNDPDNNGNRPASLKLNDTDAAQFTGSGNWDHTHPNSNSFRVGDTFTTNENNQQMIAFLFASANNADGNPISKFGTFTGSSSDVTLNVGFSTRFLIIKRVDSAGDWAVFDTVRGMISAVATYGEQIYTHSNTSQTTYTWTCPSGVSSVSVVCVGGGGGGEKRDSGHNYGIGGGGGGLGYKNNISVSAGTSYTVKVGGRGDRDVDPTTTSPNKGDSWFISAATVRGGGGEGGYDGSNGGNGGTYTGDGGGNGGRGGDSVNGGGGEGGGGGAGGYAGDGGNAPNAGNSGSGTASSGAGGGGGGSFAGGGGVGIMGQGANGAYNWNGGKGGSGGANGGEYTSGAKGGNYGGGGGCVDNSAGAGAYGGDGAVRIVWDTAGATRSFPSTNVGNTDDPRLRLNTNAAQDSDDYLSTTSTAVVLTGGNAAININGAKYIYYAHA